MNSRRDKVALEDALKIAGSKHDLVGIRVWDKREAELPDVGIIEVEDAETGQREWLDTSSNKVREYWFRRFDEEHADMQSLLKHNRIDRASVATDGDYVAELIKMFKQR